MAATNPFAQLKPAKGKPAMKTVGKKPMSAAQAAAVAKFVKGKKAAPMDAEDKLDGGVDEATEGK